MSLQFDQALTEAAGSLEALGTGWDDSGDRNDDPGSGVGAADDDVDGEGPVFDAADGARMDPLPLELQLADFERALGTILEQRDRMLYGYGEADGEESNPNHRRVEGRCKDSGLQAHGKAVPNLDPDPAVNEACGDETITFPGALRETGREAARNEAGAGGASSLLPTGKES
jgi:hypothetical protein